GLAVREIALLAAAPPWCSVRTTPHPTPAGQGDAECPGRHCRAYDNALSDMPWPSPRASANRAARLALTGRPAWRWRGNGYPRTARSAARPCRPSDYRYKPFRFLTGYVLRHSLAGRSG